MNIGQILSNALSVDDDKLYADLAAMQPWEHVRADIDVPVTVYEGVGCKRVSLWLGTLLPEDRIELRSEALLFLPRPHAGKDGVWELVESFSVDYTKPRADTPYLLTVNGNHLGALRMVTVKSDEGPWMTRITISHKRGTPKSIPFLVY